jgi:arylformamidase
MIANTGTYLDAPFHRFAEGADMAGLELGQVAAVPGLVIRQPWETELAVGVDRFECHDVAGKAVLVHTGWDRHWRTDAYFDNHPFLTAEAAVWLAAHGARLVGIDSYNIDDTRTKERPVHTGFAFTAAAPKVAGMGTFPVRAFALL